MRLSEKKNVRVVDLKKMMDRINIPGQSPNVAKRIRQGSPLGPMVVGGTRLWFSRRGRPNNLVSFCSFGFATLGPGRPFPFPEKRSESNQYI